MNKTLILLAHDDLANSNLNIRFKNELEKQNNIIYKNLNVLYPDYNIDVKKEQKDLEDVSKIVFQFPMYWYSTPAILKLWIDRVLEYGFSFIINEKGEFEAKALKGKEFQILATMGAKEESFHGVDRLSVKQCLNSVFYTMKMLGLKELEPVLFYGAEFENIVGEKLENYVKIVKKEILG